MFLRYEQVPVGATVLTAADLHIPPNATHVDLQACTQNIRYTMDNNASPAQTYGMVLITTEPPATFLISDLKNIKFVRGAGSDAKLNLHYYAGRDI